MKEQVQSAVPAVGDDVLVFELDDLVSSPKKRGVFPFGRGTLYRLIQAGEFPTGVKISARRVGWPRSAVLAYLKKVGAA